MHGQPNRDVPKRRLDNHGQTAQSSGKARATRQAAQDVMPHHGLYPLIFLLADAA